MAERFSIDLSLVGDFDDVVPLRHGAASDVFRAASPDGPVVVKIVPIRTPPHRARFDREVEAYQRLAGCPHVPSLIDHRISDGHGAVITSFVAGSDLAAALQTAGALGWTVVCDVGVLLAETVHHAHVVGVMHGDINPSNVLVDSTLTPTVIDFGGARLSLDPAEQIGINDIVYSAGFSAPEVYDGSPPTRAADIFSVGATLWAMLCGDAPFGAGTDPIADVIGRTMAASPGQLPVGTPLELDGLLGSMLAVSPARRPSSMAIVASTLRQIGRS